MTKQIGVIAGIGDKSTDTNVIMPEFDAAFRLATLSTDCVVLDGLTLSDGILKAGHVVYKGYVCELESDTVWSGTNVFLTLGTNSEGVVNSCSFSDTIESKAVIKDDQASVTPTIGATTVALRSSFTPIGTVDASKKPRIVYAYPEDTSDIAQATYAASANLISWTIVRQTYGSTSPMSVTVQIQYYIYADGVALISGGVANSEYYTYPYPRKCRMADQTTKLLANGTIASEAIATTQPVNDASRKVATTQFVQNQIAKDINAGSAEIPVYTTIKNSTNQLQIATIKLYRKSYHVYATCTVPHLTDKVVTTDNVTFTVPSGFYPTKAIRIMFAVGLIELDTAYIPLTGYFSAVLGTNGNITSVQKIKAETGTTSELLFNAFGYECQ